MRFRREWLFLFLAACAPSDDDGSTGGSSGGSTDADPTTEAASTAADSTTDASSDEPTGAVDPGPWMSLEERPCPAGNQLSMENFGAPFMLSHCTGCHHSSLAYDERGGAPLGFDFETLADVRKHAPRIWARAADQNDGMPPLGDPGQDERTRLGEWLACGAPTAAEL